MSHYQIKENNHSYEVVNAKSHLLASSAEHLTNQELIELALDVSAIKATTLIGKIENVTEVRWLIDDLFSKSIKIQNNAFSTFELSISDIKIFNLSEKGHYSLLIKNNIETSYDSYSLKVETNNVWHLLENDVSKSLAEYDHSYLYLMFNHINEITNSNYDDIYLYSSRKPELVSLIKYDYSKHKFNFKMIINEEQIPKSSQYEGYPFEYYIENNYVMDSKQENTFIKKEDKLFNDFFTKALLNRYKPSKWLR